MGFFKGALKLGAVAAAVKVARRELAKPENQQKLRELGKKAQQKLRSRKR